MAGRLDFGDSYEEAVIVLKGAVQQMHADAYGNGQPGLFKQMSDFLAAEKRAKEDRKDDDDKKHRTNTRKLNLIIALAAVVAVIVSIVALRGH